MIPYKSKLAKYKTIKGRNNGFDKLSDENKRKEIALDALSLLRKGITQALSGTYWGDDLHFKAENSKGPKDFQRSLCNLNKKEDNCEVCARGSLMLSQIRLGNSVDPSDSDADSGNRNNIKGFSMDSFHEMEELFENRTYFSSNKLIKLGMSKGSNELLANILCNVIANGDFKEDDLTNYLTKWKIKVK